MTRRYNLTNNSPRLVDVGSSVESQRKAAPARVTMPVIG